MKIGFCSLLFLLFLTLKLTGVIAWSWWWVTAPWWIPPVIVIVLGALYVTGGIFQNSKKQLEVSFAV